MSKLKQAVKLLTPPVFIKLVNKIFCQENPADIQNLLCYYGDFSSWQAAEDTMRKNEFVNTGGGYSENSILATVASSIQKVRNGEAEFERDGVLFYEKDYNYQLLSCLLYVMKEDGFLNVLDFGGALGSTYFQNRAVLKNAKWNIVEQENFVQYGKENVPEINFYDIIDDCLSHEPDINCVLFSSVLQYLGEPYSVLENVLHRKVKYLLVDRTPFNFEARDRIVLQNVPEQIYKAVYPLHLFNGEEFMQKICGAGYKEIFKFVQPLDKLPLIENDHSVQIINHGCLMKVVD